MFYEKKEAPVIVSSLILVASFERFFNETFEAHEFWLCDVSSYILEANSEIDPDPAL